MKILIYIFPIAFLLWILICICVWGRIFNKFFYLIIILFFSAILFLFLSKPENYGSWNLLTELNREKITKIQIVPSEQYYDVNLVHNSLVITDSMEISTIFNLLSNSYYLIPNHPNRIWQTNLIIVTKNRKLIFNVSQTTNQGTIIYSSEGKYQNNNLGLYLKKYLSAKRSSTIIKIESYR